jgi:UDP-glucuronate decarboxylase
MHPNDGRVVSNFVIQALKGESISIYGDGQQTRSFCYVDDLIEGIYRLMQSPADFTGPCNLGNPNEFTMLELAKTIIDLTGSKSEIVHMPLPSDDPRQRQPDISRARLYLGWEPKIALREGLKNTIGYFESRIREGAAD